MTNELTPADIRACTGGNDSRGWGGDGAWWIIILFLFAFAGGWGNGGFGGGQGAANNYVLASDFATIQRQLSDGFGGVEKGIDTIRNGLCDGFYSQAQLVNGINTNILQTGNALGTQIAQCCCDVREGISGVNYNLATQANNLSREVERGFCDTNYNNQTQHFQTMQAINKVGDRVIDYLSQKEAQSLRDENFALRLSASQAAQNNYLVQQLGQKCPVPAYLTCNPNAPINYSVNYGNGCGCGC